MKAVTQDPKPVEIIAGRFVVMFEAQEEDIDPRKHFVTECGWTPKEYAKQRNTQWFGVHITLWTGGKQVAEQFLGACAYKNPDEFWQRYRGDYYADMVHECLTDAGESVLATMWRDTVRAETAVKQGAAS
jgi:hypothetical protein